MKINPFTSFLDFFLLATTLLVVFQVGCTRSARVIDGYGAAAEWNDLSNSERSTYVEGYTSGYGLGSSAACDNADKLFEARSPRFDKNGYPNNPVRQCEKAVDKYTRMGDRGKQRPDYSMYSDIITDVYRKYPKYDKVPFAFLMILLSDNQYTSADQVVQKLEKNDMQWTY